MKKVLIVDDDAAVRNAVCVTLNNAGYEATMAASAPEGIEKFDQEKPDVVIVDLLMPYVGGVAAILDIRRVARRQSRSVSIVVLSGGDMDDVKDAMAAGADAYVQKPVNKNQVLDVLRKLPD